MRCAVTWRAASRRAASRDKAITRRFGKKGQD
jgi:hypothetical protein